MYEKSISNNDTLLSIGEIADVCNVSQKTLRHYDSIGLLKPILVKPENGYRYYSNWQITRIMTIKELQSAGISLSEIKMCLRKCGSDLNLQDIYNIIEIQETKIIKQIQTSYTNLEKIKSFKQQYKKINEAFMEVENSKVILKKFDRRRIIFKEYSGSYNKKVFSVYYKELAESLSKKGYSFSAITTFPMAIYQNIFNDLIMNVKIGFEIDAVYWDNDFKILDIPESYYASYIYKGNYSVARKEAYSYLYKFIKENNYQVDGESIEIYYITQNITVKQDDFITEIQIPICKV